MQLKVVMSLVTWILRIYLRSSKSSLHVLILWGISPAARTCIQHTHTHTHTHTHHLKIQWKTSDHSLQIHLSSVVDSIFFSILRSLFYWWTDEGSVNLFSSLNLVRFVAFKGNISWRINPPFGLIDWFKNLYLASAFQYHHHISNFMHYKVSNGF